MELYYQGKDITSKIQVRGCVARDAAGRRSDSLKIELDNAVNWHRWGPQVDDQIRVLHGSYDTGTMYLHSVLPEDGKYTILASSLPCRARRHEYRSFSGKSIEDIIRICAMVSGMGYQLFGIESKRTIPYIQQENEGCAAFLNRFLALEGAALKCINGKYTAIGIQYAQARPPHQTIEISASRRGFEYNKSGERIRSLTVRTPYGSATATDTAAQGTAAQLVLNDLPVRDSIQAGRWARGLLLSKNRFCEAAVIQSEFNVGFTAMTRIDITGNTEASGEWLIEEAEHDFINLTSTARMHRCVRTIQ